MIKLNIYFRGPGYFAGTNESKRDRDPGWARHNDEKFHEMYGGMSDTQSEMNKARKNGKREKKKSIIKRLFDLLGSK